MTKLELEIEKNNNKSIVKNSYFTSPLKLGYPSVDSNNRLEVVFMMASAGMLKGDVHNYNIICREDTKTTITDQSYCKVFNTEEGYAKRNIIVNLEENASLYYKPHSVIPFLGSTYLGNIEFSIKNNSELAYFDIFASGRTGMGESFKFNKYTNRVQININGKPVWIDNCSLKPEKQNLQENVFFKNYTHMGTFFYYGVESTLEKLTNYICKNTNLYFGSSLASKGITIRFLGNNSQDIEEEFDIILSIIK